MKVRMLLDGGTPKVAPGELERVIVGSGMKATAGEADFGIVVGGDGRFSRYGRTEEIPLLFVGVRSKGATGSKAHLAQTNFDELPAALSMIKKGHYTIDEHRRLAVFKDKTDLGEIFTDVYLQRGSESTCIRYRVEVSGRGLNLKDSAIGDGVIVSTRAGASGYYSYPDRIRGDDMDPSAFADLESDQVGICHVDPTYTEREATGRHPLRYTIPWGSKVELSLFRTADARLYGTTDAKGGVKVSLDERVTVLPGKKITKLLVLGK